MRVALAVALLLVPALLPALARAEITGPVRVIDGDTLEVAGRRVDLVGVDAPELAQQCRRGERVVPCGEVAMTQLMDLTAGAEVVCDPLREEGGVVIARCTANGYDLSEGLEHTGWGLGTAEATARYREVQARAKQAGRGLWGMEFVPPWAWRRGERLSGESE